ncbi:LuxR C-terminal-related transcriptional regulator [Parathalassolituus penaei]|uniref:LuxR C-terminal-related transcriptional regulator n=1 Tax=Parathalassolituus penaei TaxID=2997323 RepID=UPI0024B38815|nr:LuxR C-terminal-related transcriptional regulator [Parathalassolituus penaei]
MAPPPRSPSVDPALLDHADDHTCCLFLAPGGAGKTQFLLRAIASWHQRHASPPLWLPLQSGHAGPLQLLEMLARANGQPEDSGLQAADPLVSLQEWLVAVAAQELPVLICIDDIQHLRDSASWQFVQTLVNQRPRNLRLLLAGREAPAPLGKWQLLPDWQFAGLEAGCFSAADTSRWFLLQEIELDTVALDSLASAFAGWPAALTIWLGCYRAAGRHGQGGVAFGPELARPALEDYWRGEIECELAPQSGRLLRLMAALPRLPEAALSSMLGTDVAPLLQQLQQQGLLVWRHDHYRLVAAFQWLLTGMSSEVERCDWNQSAFRWYSQQGQPVKALQHARLSNELETLAPWVEAHAENILASLDFSGLVRWCEMAGDELLGCSPRLMQIACWAWLLTWRPRRAEPMLRQLQQRQYLKETELLALHGYLARLRGQQRSAIKMCRRAWQHLPERRASVRFLMANSMAYLALGENDLDASRRWSQQSLEVAREFDKPALEALALFDLARVELHRGLLPQALELVERGLQCCQLNGLEDSMAMGRLQLYRVFLGWVAGDTSSELDTILLQGIHCSQRHSDVLVCYGFGLQAMQAAARGHWRQGLDILDEAERLMQQWGVDRDSYRWLVLVKANVWLTNGNFLRAHDCLDDLLQGQSVQQLPRADVFPMLPDFAAATRARLFLLAGEYEQCLQEVDEWLRCHSSPVIMLLVQLIRAAALRGCQQDDESLALFAQVQQQLQRLQMPEVFAFWVPEIHAPVIVADDDGRTPLTRVQLSDREHDVLRKIAEGLSNEEIARQLFISLHTVKSHARRINAKLGVRNRTQAIHRAREMLLL